MTELETDELNDQYAQSWLVSSVARHKGVSINDVSAFLEDYTFSTAKVGSSLHVSHIQSVSL